MPDSSDSSPPSDDATVVWPPPVGPGRPPHGTSKQHEGWSERPWAARAIGALAYLIPFIASIVAAMAMSSALPQAPNVPVGAVRWLGIAIASTVVLVVVERQTRRLLPLRTLLGLTLAFPDKAPSRFKIAMRTGTTNQLQRRLAEARNGKLGDTPSEAAERLLELVATLSQHDRLTRGHSERVRAYSHLIGEEMGMSGEQLDRLRWAGLLHDVGKLAISPDILNKPTKLTSEEFDLIKTHPMEGKKLVEPLASWLGEAARAVWEHHERFDGSGYPCGLAGTEISLEARVVSVADVFDVMTSVRSYKNAASAKVARKELADCAGTQFDPDVVRAFLAVSVPRVRTAMGPLSWFMQLSLFPGAVAAQVGPTIATAAAVTAGAAAGTVGMVASPVGPVVANEPVEAVVLEQVVSDIDDPIVLDDFIPSRTASTTSPPAPQIAPASSTVPPTTRPGGASPTETVPSGAPPTTIATGGGTRSTTPGATVAPIVTTAPAVSTVTSTNAPATAAPTTTSTTSTTTSTTTTSTTSTTTSTTTTTVPGFAGSSVLFLLPSGPGDTSSQAHLPLGVEPPADIGLANYDIDRDGDPGLLIEKDSAGVDGSDPTKVQIFTVAHSSAVHIEADLRAELYVAAKDFDSKDILVAVLVERCDLAGTCMALGYSDKWVRNADRFKRVTVPLGDIATTIEPGDRLQLRVAALGESDDDMWLAFGTDAYSSSIHFDD